MAKITLDRTNWTAINAAAARVQVVGGPVMVADSNAPTADDWHTWPEGAIVDITAVKYAQAASPRPTYIVRLAV